MALILMPIAVTVFGICLFSIPLLVGGAMLRGRTSNSFGKKILTYSSCALSGGVVCRWIAFIVMLFASP